MQDRATTLQPETQSPATLKTPQVTAEFSFPKMNNPNTWLTTVFEMQMLKVQINLRDIL